MTKQEKEILISFLEGHKECANIDKQNVEYDSPEDLKYICDDDDTYVYGWWNGTMETLRSLIESANRINVD